MEWVVCVCVYVCPQIKNQNPYYSTKTGPRMLSYFARAENLKG